MLQHDDVLLKKTLLAITEETVREIVDTMLFIGVSAGHGIAKPTGIAHIAARAEASAIIGLNGGLNGGVRLACSNRVALILASALSGESYKTMSDDAKDGFAEVGNMIAGGIQTRLGERMPLGEINMTPPTVILGADYEVDYRSSFESIRYFFRVEDEPFYIEVYYLVDSKFSVTLDSSLFPKMERLRGRFGDSHSEVITRLVDLADQGGE
ncbi:MAG: chemotaxis protein CheX [Magnetococcales bacterium]|nr:chemotaxis protein CheX [Magnetococcales bacterium]